MNTNVILETQSMILGMGELVGVFLGFGWGFFVVVLDLFFTQTKYIKLL